MHRLVMVLLAAVILAGLGFLFLGVCADGGAMASAYRTCECRGVEWEMYDRTAADGPRRTLCIGLRRSTTCYRSRGGPEVPCADRPGPSP
jgi:hypothetical protein